MFESLHFKETLCNFQQLIREGVFDLSFSFGNQVDCRTLNRLVLVCLSNFKWIEHYNTMKVKLYQKFKMTLLFIETFGSASLLKLTHVCYHRA